MKTTAEEITNRFIREPERRKLTGLSRSAWYRLEAAGEGWTVPSPKNPLQQIRNPLLDALTLISSRQLSLTRALALNGPPSDRKTISKNARTVADARRTAAESDLDSLLAQPVTQ